MTLDIAIRGKKTEDPLIFLGHFIRLWFNEFLDQNVEWSFRGFLFLKQETGRAKKKVIQQWL